MTATRAWFVLGALLAALLAWSVLGGSAALVVYCAHDAVHAERVLRRFEAETGIAIEVRFDTEATKSLGLVELIARERDRPRCDVFWNNEVLGSMRLAGQGLLEAYRGAGWQRIPAGFRDPDARWTGFAGRLRVWIHGPGAAARASLEREDLSVTAIAKPLYGTTRTHYTALWHALGPDELQRQHRAWRERGLREVLGNATVKQLVAAGTCEAGLTDTDDFFAAVDAGAPVAMTLARVDGRVVLVPNTAAIVRGTERRADAERLVDFLLSEAVEVELARSPSRQVPLGPTAQQLPTEVEELRDAARAAYPLHELATGRAACLAWLRSEYLR